MKSEKNVKQFNNLPFQRQQLLIYIHEQDFSAQELLSKALKIAEDSHQGQKRDDGEPYIIHPIRCAVSLIQEFGIKDPELIEALILHDVVEDTPVTLEDLRRDFDERVVTLVDHLTRPRPADEPEEVKYHEKVAKLTWYLSADHETRLLKCMDLLDNLRSWPYLSKKVLSQPKYSRWFVKVEELGLPLGDKTDSRVDTALRQALQELKEHMR